ncbi:fimbria/pilus outer membrane usher protein [Polaromonas sp.]|uniref:fimbria/pilus outer membrane usher protein n=1 Tax=Polaromonas sp. TaxID=1869339 RepID=UPI001E01C243|nr:fimbria/pilus outer membrane usher protein [Polaromonas sp.]MBT9477151.1 fimbrial biogenesis outer membrane usher protein [Polaromonas sp.]
MRAISAKHSRINSKLVSTALCLAVAISPPSLAEDKPNPSAVSVAVQMETLILRVTLNTENKGDAFVQRSADLDFFLKVEDLKAMGVKDPTGTIQVIDGEPHVSLRSIKGITSTFDEKALTLNISAEPQLLSSSSFGLRAERRRGTLSESTNSAFLNYALTGMNGSFASSNGVGFAAEAGVRWGDNLFMSDASTVDTAAGKHLVRLTSSMTRDDRENLRRIVIGDLLTPSRDFSNSINLGGVSISKLYGLDPYFVRFPTQSLTGSVALPSDLEVYLDGQKIRTERLRPGEFELRDILAYGGARNVQVILRDAFGRVQQLNYSLYFSDQPLQHGLHEYSYNFGAMRRQFGIQSNNYGPAAFTMFHRYGLGSALTVGWRAETTRDFLNTGPTLTAVLGSFGVVNLGLTGSTLAGRKGAAGLASYNFDSRNWALGMFLRHDSRNYASLGDPPVMTTRRNESSVSASYRLPQNATVSLSHTALTTRAFTETTSTPMSIQPFNVAASGNRRVNALTFSAPLGAMRAQLTATVSHIKDALTPSRTEAFVSLNLQLDRNYSAASNYRADRQNHSESVRFTKYQPAGEGLGYDLSLGHSNANTGNTQFRSNMQYNAPATVLRAEVSLNIDQGKRTQDQRLSVAGGIVAVGGRMGLSRPVTQSYAIVKVGEVPDVGVLVDGQPVGKTNSKGLAVIPNLNAYYENRVSIATEALPMNYTLPAAIKRVAPSLRSGAFVDFGATKIQAFSGKLMTLVAGAAKALEFTEIDLIVNGKPQKLPTGRGGEFYVENIQPGSYAGTAATGAAQCVFTLKVPKSDEMFVDLGELLCTQQP